MDDRLLALCEISNDLLFEKIPKGKLAYYVDHSLKAGRNAAEGLKGREIHEIYSENCITVAKHAPQKSSFGVILRGMATMSEKGCSIEVYGDSVRELAKYAGMDYGLAERVHLAHELFHFLEYKRGRSFSDELEKVVTVRIFGYSRKAKINRCEEVAAHAFAKEMLDLPCLPNYYDYLYLVGAGKMTREALDGKLRVCSDMLNAA
ncbi:MAG: hypothetical protein LBL96_10330 [Clostridiales bacterium]|nr:hypothetical protein [Clostridiales bacterium]